MASWNLVNIGLGCGLFPVCCQVNTWSSADLFPVGPLEINFSEIQIAIQTFLLKKMHLEMSSANCWPFSSNQNIQMLVKINPYHVILKLFQAI